MTVTKQQVIFWMNILQCDEKKAKAVAEQAIAAAKKYEVDNNK